MIGAFLGSWNQYNCWVLKHWREGEKLSKFSRVMKKGKLEKESDGKEKVVVAVKASKEIPKTALVWALTHVVHPGDCITLLVVIPSQSSGTLSLSFL